MSDLQQPTASSPTMVADAIPSAVASATATVPHLKPSHSTDTLMAGGVAGIQLNLQQSSPMPHVHDHGHAHMAIDKTVTAVADNAMDTDLIRPEAPNTQPQSAWAAATSGQSPSNAIISPTARMSITATTTIAHPATDRKRARVQSIVAVQGAGTHVLDLDMGKIAPSVACEWNVVSALAESPPQLSVPLSPVTTSQHIDGEVTDAAAQSEAHANKLRRVKTRSRDNSFSSSTSGRRSVDERRTSASGNMQSPTPPPPVATPLRITIKSTGEFQDQFGRTIWMRGVNLCAKLPQGQSASDKPPASESFFDDRNVSFVGQPFPLAEADEHFTRLRVWGLTLVRLGVTWEALEHAGPGKYDEAYVEYLIKFVEKAGHHGFRVIIDPHQGMFDLCV